MAACGPARCMSDRTGVCRRSAGKKEKPFSNTYYRLINPRFCIFTASNFFVSSWHRFRKWNMDITDTTDKK
jgi:hypothetical protein